MKSFIFAVVWIAVINSASAQEIPQEVLVKYCVLDASLNMNFTATWSPMHLEIGGAKIDVGLKEIQCRNLDRNGDFDRVEALDLKIMYIMTDKGSDKAYTALVTQPGDVVGYVFLAPLGDGRAYMHDVRGPGVGVRVTPLFQEGKTGPDAVSGARLELFGPEGEVAKRDVVCVDQPCPRVR